MNKPQRGEPAAPRPMPVVEPANNHPPGGGAIIGGLILQGAAGPLGVEARLDHLEAVQVELAAGNALHGQLLADQGGNILLMHADFAAAGHDRNMEIGGRLNNLEQYVNLVNHHADLAVDGVEVLNHQRLRANVNRNIRGAQVDALEVNLAAAQAQNPVDIIDPDPINNFM